MIDPCIETQARRRSHTTSPDAHLLRALLAELDTVRGEVLRVEAADLETARQADLAVPR